MAGVDEIIRQWVAKVEKTGELKNDPKFGKPLELDRDGYAETPEELRAAYKILKNAGYVPAEIEFFRTLATLREQLASTSDETEARALRTKIAEIEQKITMMLERARSRR
jgi:DnaJ-like protein